MFTCQICHKGFAASNTLSRHLQNHQESQLYTCDLCEVSFHRQDLLARHDKIHSIVDEAPTPEPASGSSIASRRRRARTACDRCRHDRLRCNGRQPCERCLVKQRSCNFSPKGGKLSKDNKVLATSNLLSIASNRHCNDAASAPTLVSQDGQPGLKDDGSIEQYDTTCQDDSTALNGISSTSSTITCAWRTDELSPYNDFDADWHAFLAMGVDPSFESLSALDQLHGIVQILGKPLTDGRPPDSQLRYSARSSVYTANTKYQVPSQATAVAYIFEAAVDWTVKSLEMCNSGAQYSVSIFRNAIELQASKLSEDLKFELPSHVVLGGSSFQGLFCLDVMAELFYETVWHLWMPFPQYWQTNDNTHPLLYLCMVSIGAMFCGEQSTALGTEINFRLQELVVQPWLDYERADGDMYLQIGQTRALTEAIALYYGEKPATLYAQNIGASLLVQARQMNLFSNASSNLPPLSSTESRRDWVSKWVRHECRNRLAYNIMRPESFVALLHSAKPLFAADGLDINLPCSRRLWSAKFDSPDSFAAAIMQEYSVRRPSMRFSDVLMAALNIRGNFPALDCAGQEILVTSLQDRIWSLCRDRTRVSHSTFNYSTAQLGVGSWLRPTTEPGESRTESGQTRPSSNLLQPFTPRPLHNVRHRENSIMQTASALRRWQHTCLKGYIPTNVSERSSLLNCTLLYHLSFLRLYSPLDLIHSTCYKTFIGSTLKREVSERVLSWIKEPAATIAVKHAITIFDILLQEVAEPLSRRSFFHYPTMGGLTHGAAIIWTFAGMQWPPENPHMLSMPISRTERAFVTRDNTRKIIGAYLKLFDAVNPGKHSETLFRTDIARLETQGFHDIYGVHVQS